MGNGSRWLAVVLTLALVAAVGTFTYSLGVAHGVAQTAPAVAAPGAPGTVAPYVLYPRPWGWGFGFFPFFGLIWIFLLFAFVRRLWWGPRWYRGGCGGFHYDDRVPTQFEEWHRRAHGQPNAPAPTKL